MQAILEQKYRALQENIRALGSVAVAFSGGVDSTLLLKVAHDVLGDAAAGVTVQADIVPPREMQEAADFCKAQGIRQIVCRVDALALAGFADNPPDRCYWCKKNNFSEILKIAAAGGFASVAEGSNLDDLGDYRPGMQAVAELAVVSPLRKAGLTKDDIRAISRELGLPTWDKPSYACLASRFAYGEKITEEKLAMVDKAEQLLIDLGYRQMRVRIHGERDYIARIELPAGEMATIFENREAVNAAFRSLGFRYVTVDLMGYRTGSMNETLGADQRQ
ncbi:ATP-dependent sacrificial sulfur transferase LarE [Pseudoramibacter faecis]|uniref:ATP-dependent sacrificial sulfur transferase LarE n=1 Tax=Pseudoramibacter faecis TaxID=3108534 RepID=UPI002E779C66|nr:ATP-dependent sacrificial sulfur transferase LarE [Pseudoramibacter sp. HA2172]